MVSSFLETGGIFYIRDGHPVAYTLDFEEQDKLIIKHPYFEITEPLAWSDPATYAGEVW